MQRHRTIPSIAAALAVWAGPAFAEPPELGGEVAEAPAKATWQLVEARNHVTGATGLAAVVFGVAQERGRSRLAILRVDCFDELTTLHVDDEQLRSDAAAIAVKYSIDGGRFVSGAWQTRGDSSGLELSGERAIAFVSELYGSTELRVAIVRPLSVPYLLTFAVGGAEQSLRPMAERCHWANGSALSDAGR
jgi:hypothetical protein